MCNYANRKIIIISGIYTVRSRLKNYYVHNCRHLSYMKNDMVSSTVSFSSDSFSIYQIFKEDIAEAPPLGLNFIALVFNLWLPFSLFSSDAERWIVSSEILLGISNGFSSCITVWIQPFFICALRIFWPFLWKNSFMIPILQSLFLLLSILITIIGLEFFRFMFTLYR